MYYDPSKELVLACDTSPYGVGAVSSHKKGNGFEKPITFASRSLALAKIKCSHPNKEGLVIIFGIKHFHQYIFSCHFTILSDHKLLQHLFKQSSVTPTLASAQIQRWALILGAYHYTIQYKPGREHANADVMSRLSLSDVPTNVPVPGETNMLMDMLNSLPITADQIKS